jgi:hypothetical protein
MDFSVSFRMARKPVIGIKDVPITGGGFDHETKSQVAKPPDQGHFFRARKSLNRLPFVKSALSVRMGFINSWI